MPATALPDPGSLEPSTQLILASRTNSVAIEQLFGVLGSRLRRILLVRSSGAPARELDDIAQDSLLEAWRDFQNVNPTTSGALLRWITTIAMNNLRDRARWQRVRQDLHPLRTELATHLADPTQRSPQTFAEASELEQTTDQALQSLGETDRELLLMRYYEGASAREIATAMDLPSEEAVRARLMRARRRLEAKLDKEGSA